MNVAETLLLRQQRIAFFSLDSEQQQFRFMATVATPNPSHY